MGTSMWFLPILFWAMVISGIFLILLGLSSSNKKLVEKATDNVSPERMEKDVEEASHEK